MMNDNPAVDVQDLSRSFRGKQALDHVDLQIPTGSVFGLIGLNGTGKTTLIRHLIGLLKAKTGTVQVLGQNPVTDPESFLKRIGYLTEEDSLPKWASIGELIDFSRAVYPSWDDAYAKQLLDSFGLTRSDRLRTLSKGQRARVGLLLAITHRPELLILDEPSSGLDPIARSDILEAIIRTVNEDGRTVLFSSHLLDEVDRVCDRIALIHDGQIIESVTTEQIQTRYVEIIFQNSTEQTQTPSLEGAFGWKRIGDEWSAVAERESRSTQSPPVGWTIVTRRDISLSRWFEGRVGGRPESFTTADRSVEVTSDV